ncbi:putative quinone oxidoreductase [Gaertneriomyces semiglobifer]|nr:putative quinone oxidoreductase [Gaertneriomyces semiglobifer]
MASNTMLAVVVKEPGSASGMVIESVPRPTVKETDLLVKIYAFGLNRMDIMQRDGHYPVPKGAPSTLGVEFAGVVDSIGADVVRYKPGDKVFGLVYGGAYAQYVTIAESMAISMPESLSFQQAAAIPEVWMTAYQALFFINNLKTGEDILIHAGASSVGIAAIQLAKQAGANKIIVTAGSAEKLEFCKGIGATHGINYRTQDFQEEVQQITSGNGVAAIVDFIGANYWNSNIGSLARDGRMCMLALMGGASVDHADIGPILMKRLKIEGSTLRSRDITYQTRLRDAVVEHVLPHILNGELKAIIDREYPWGDIVQAHRRMEANETKGKIIVTVKHE